MKESVILAQRLPAVSKEFALGLKETFRPIVVKPGVTHDQVMYNAGQLAVVEFVLRHMAGPDTIAVPEQPQKKASVWERLQKGLRYGTN